MVYNEQLSQQQQSNHEQKEDEFEHDFSGRQENAAVVIGVLPPKMDISDSLASHPSSLVSSVSRDSEEQLSSDGTGLARKKGGRRIFYSFEFFPPKTAAGVVNLYSRIDFMSSMEPLFVDITWGTGAGRTSNGLLSLEIAKTVQQFCPAEVMMHLTWSDNSLLRDLFSPGKVSIHFLSPSLPLSLFLSFSLPLSLSLQHEPHSPPGPGDPGTHEEGRHPQHSRASRR